MYKSEKVCGYIDKSGSFFKTEEEATASNLWLEYYEKTNELQKKVSEYLVHDRGMSDYSVRSSRLLETLIPIIVREVFVSFDLLNDIVEVRKEIKKYKELNKFVEKKETGLERILNKCKFF